MVHCTNLFINPAYFLDAGIFANNPDFLFNTLETPDNVENRRNFLNNC